MRTLTRTSTFWIIVLWLVASMQWISGRRTIPWDSTDVYFHWASFVANSLARGDTPLWNPFLYGGFPQAADPQGLVFSPLIVAALVLTNPSSATIFNLAVVGHLLLGGLALAAWLRALSIGATGQWLAACIFMFGGSAMGRLQHTTFVVGYAAAPIVLWGIHRAFAKGDALSALLVLSGALLFGTHLTQVTYLFVPIVIAYVLLLAIRQTPAAAPASKSRGLLLICAGGSGALLLVLPFLLLVFSNLPDTNRVKLPLQEAVAGQINLWEFVNLLIGNAFGHRWGDAWIERLGDRSQGYLYCGLMAVYFAMWALFAKHQNRANSGSTLERRLSAAVGIVAVLYALGLQTPLYGWLYEFVPGVSLFRRPSDAAYVITFVMAILAGIGFDDWQRRPHRGQPAALASHDSRWPGVIYCVSFLASATAAVAVARSVGASSSAAKSAAIALAVAATVTVAVWGLQCKSMTRAALFVCVLTAIDLIAHNVTFKNASAPMLSGAPAQLAASVSTFLRESLRDPIGIPERAELINIDYRLLNRPSSDGFAGSQGHSPLRLSRYQRVFGTQQDSAQPRPFTPWLPSYSSALFSLSGTKFVVSLRSIEKIDPLVRPGDFVSEKQFDAMTVWRHVHTLPRVLNPRSVTWMSRDEGFPASITADQLRDRVFMSRDSSSPQEQELFNQCKGNATIRLLEYRNGLVALSVAASEPAIVVLTDLHHPWWRAEINGERVPMLRANVLYRAVCVPKGNHELRFRLTPFSNLFDR